MSLITRSASLRREGTFISPKLYLPASSAGSPSFSPAYDTNIWNSTGSATRVVGRFGKKYGTSLETVTIQGNDDHIRRLARQFVIPLSDLGLYHPTLAEWLYPPVYFKVRVGTLGTEIHPITLFRITDASGNTIDAPPTQSGISFTAGSATMVGSGFSSGDVGSLFVVENKDNIIAELGNRPGMNSITGFTNSTHVTIQNTYPASSDVIGTSRTIRFIEDGRSLTYFGGSETTTSDVVVGGAPLFPNPAGVVFGRAHYLVIEIGFMITRIAGSTTLRNYRMSFGDPSDDTMETDSSGSSGGISILSACSPLISLSL